MNWFHLPPSTARWLWAAAVGVGLAAGGPGSASAQSAANGLTLYKATIVSGKNSCAASSCHGSNPASNLNRIQRGASAQLIKNATSSQRDMTFLSGHLTDAQYNDLAAYIASATGLGASYIATSAAPALSLAATALAFGSVTVGHTSTRTVTLTNSGSAALNLSSIGLSAASSHYSTSEDCPASLAVGSACTLTANFTPASAGSKTATVQVVSNASGSPHSIGLSGSGTSAATGTLGWSVAGTSVAFANTTVGIESAVTTLTLSNTGAGVATLGSISVGGTDAGQFIPGGTCTSGTTLAASAGCTVTLIFAPSLAAGAGSKSATLTVLATNANNPTVLSLSGTATAAPSGGTGNNPNVGGGGCTVAPGGPANAPALDPLLALLAAGAALALLGRRRAASSCNTKPNTPEL